MITRRSSAEVRSSGVSVGVDGRKWRGRKKTRKEELFGRCEPRWKLSWTDEALQEELVDCFQGWLPTLIHVLVDRGVGRAAAG